MELTFKDGHPPPPLCAVPHTALPHIQQMNASCGQGSLWCCCLCPLPCSRGCLQPPPPFPPPEQSISTLPLMQNPPFS